MMDIQGKKNYALIGRNGYDNTCSNNSIKNKKLFEYKEIHKLNPVWLDMCSVLF